MKFFGLVVASYLLIHSCFAQGPPPVSAITEDGFDTIHLDYPSWLTQIKPAYDLQSSILVYGSNGGKGYSRMVGTQTFSAYTAITGPGWNLPFLDVDYFNDEHGSIWTTGPIGPTVSGPLDFEVAIGIAGGPTGAYQTASLGQGYLPLAVRVDASAAPIITSYFLGYVQPPNGSDAVFGWGIMRTTANVDTITGNNNNTNTFGFDPDNDVKVIGNVPFNIRQQDQNFIHHDPELGVLYVIDNYADVLYVVSLPFTNQSMTTATITSINLSNLIPLGYAISSFAYISSQRNLYIGCAANGIGQGQILVLNVLATNPTVTYNFTLPTNFSNPAAMAVSLLNNTLYVATNGGPAIVTYDINTLEIKGYQNLPHYLHRVWAAHVSGDNVYFVTNEQHSKVFRVHKEDFCATQCPSMGHCEKGKCLCDENYSLLEGVCQPTIYVQEHTTERKVHGGETALGILFMLAVIVAVVGWLLFFRNRRSTASYQPVL